MSMNTHRVTRFQWLIIILAFATADIAGVVWWKRHHRRVTQAPIRLPRFEDHPCTSGFNATSHPPALTIRTPEDLIGYVHDDLKDWELKNFRTRLMESVKAPPNFAGFYTVVEWGCGTGCQIQALVDHRTGTVYFFPEITASGAEFRLNSSLFIVNPPESVKESYDIAASPRWLYSYYFIWREEWKQFELLYTDNPEWKYRFRAATVPPSLLIYPDDPRLKRSPN